MEQQQMDLFEDGGLRDQGGGKDPVSGNDVPVGSLEKEVRDDIPAMLSEGEFIFPADVVRYWGLDLLMQMRQEAKQGLKKMEDMGQMGNSEEATLPDDMPFNMDDIETGDEPAFKFNVGGLAADPRFATQNVNVPTYTEEDKKNMETAVLSGIFGDITMKRYVNADGKVIYIPFIGDKPQAPIPEGYNLDESPVVSSPSTARATTDSGGGGSTYDPALTPLDRALQQPDMPKVKSVDINKMSPEELVAYYESFTSPMARFASVGAGLLFGPLVGAGLALAQQWSIRNGPNSFVNTEKKLAELISTGKLKDAGLIKRITNARKLAKENGVGPVSLLSKIGEKLGLSKGPDSDILSKDLADAIKNGVFPKNAEKIFNEKEAIEQALREIDPKTLPQSGTFGTQYTEVQPSNIDRGNFETIGTTPANFDYGTVPEFGEGQRVQPVTVQPTDAEANYLKASGAVQPEDPFALTSDQFVPDYGFDDKAQEQAREERMRDRRSPITKFLTPIEEVETKSGVEQDRRIKQKPAYVPTYDPDDERRTATDFYDLPQQQDDDRDDGGPSSDPQNYGSPFDNTGQTTTPRTDTYADLTGSPFGDTGRSQASQAVGTSGGAGQRFGPTGGFYVGGVPTKPIKPQRLKKGGLAKPKVKPKKMKKGGLASKK
tara:strand:- start:1395 stop:3371 length:1977 start_codon:yes stop_codon:yes gene_type:complete